MADIALTTDNKIDVVESIVQDTQPAGAGGVSAGDAVRYNSVGRFVKADTTAAANARAFGIATRTAIEGEAVTAIRKGVLDGYVLDALAYGADVFLARTTGRVADATDATAGAVNKTLGQVIPLRSSRISAGADKGLYVDL